MLVLFPVSNMAEHHERGDKMVEQWFELYADDVYSFLAYMVRDRELAKDLTQETFIKAMKGVNSFRADSSPKTWLLTIARNVALNHNRKIQSEVLVDEFSFDLLSSPMESLEDTVQRRDTYRRLLDVAPKHEAVVP